MGGSATNSNAQLFSLMSQYGGTEAPQQRRRFNMDAALAGLGDSHKGNLTSIWGALDRRDGGGGRRGGSDSNSSTTTQPPATEAEKFQWQFPQYTQTWAFTPPPPTPYMYPQPFDPKKFGDPLPTGKKK